MGSIIIDRVNQPSETLSLYRSDCLILGNLAGLLRVFHIEGIVSYRAEHLLIEQQLEQPILQVIIHNTFF